MSAKKLGKAKIDLENEVWIIENKEGAYLFNRRLVDTRPEIKAVRSTFGKEVQKDTPAKRKYEKREAYDTTVKEYRKQMLGALTFIYSEMLEDSHQAPIPLRRDRDYDHKGDWRYCLYQGFIYKFDHPGLSEDEMLKQIQALSGPVS